MALVELKSYCDGLEVVANVATVAAALLAFWVYFSNRKKISAAIQLLLNYSFQTTITELKEKLERLNEYNANEPDDVPEIRNILHEIAGQIRGNDRLNKDASGLADKVERLAKAKQLLEPQKRALVSEVREKLKNIQVNSLEFGDGNE